MHELRNAILAGEAATAKPQSAKEANRRRRQGLSDVAVERDERRTAEQRGEDRFRGRIERAILVFRGKKILVRVMNLSASGLMIEAEIGPEIGETVGLEIDGFERMRAVVRWIRAGRIGLDVGEGTFALG